MSELTIGTASAFEPNVTGGGGGGPAPGGTIDWGPDFGGTDGDQFQVGVALTMPSLALSANQGVGVALTMPALALSANQGVGVKLTGSVLGAPFWQSVQTAALTAAGTSITVNIPTSTAVGDLLVAFIGNGVGVAASFASVNTPTGWTRFSNVDFTGTSDRLSAYGFWRIADGTEGASQTFTFAASSAHGCGEIHRVTGTDPTTPVNVSGTATLAASALNPDPVSPAVTTTVANCLVFAWLLHDHAALSNTHTAPASHAERTDFQSTVSATVIASTADTRVFATAASTGTATHDCTETAATDAVMTRVAIAPGTIVIAA